MLFPLAYVSGATGRMLPPLAPWNMSGATWAAREENGVGVSSTWVDDQDLAAGLDHQALLCLAEAALV